MANIYDHAGVVDAQRLNPLQPSIPCVVSATPAMEFPPPVIHGDGGDFPDPQDGVRYQSPAELLDEFPTWTRLSVKGGIPAGYGDWSAGFTSRYTAADTAYSNFQPLGGRLTLSPILRQDSRYWYCSKVPWRIYHDFPARTNLEYGGQDGVADPAGSMDFYSGKRWVSQKLTLLHLFYLIMASVAYGPIEGYEMIDEDQREILTELVSPDEIRADAGEYSRIETWGSSEAVRELERNWEDWTDDLGLAEP